MWLLNTWHTNMNTGAASVPSSAWLKTWLEQLHAPSTKTQSSAKAEALAAVYITWQPLVFILSCLYKPFWDPVSWCWVVILMKNSTPGECRNLSFHGNPITAFNCRINLRTPNKEILKDENLKVNKKTLPLPWPNFIKANALWIFKLSGTGVIQINAFS